MSMVETAPSKIQVRNLNFYYGKFHALKNINLDIAKNQVTAFIGPSGCGKSTLLRTFNKMFELYPEQRAEGEILLDGDNILTNSQDIALLRAKVGMVFQKPTPFPMSIYDNIAFGVRLFEKLSRADMDERVQWALTKAALWNETKDKLHQSGYSLSGGQQQRLCIARGIAIRPEVLLLDEPCSALDPISTGRIEELITELKQDYTVVIVTHNMQQAARCSNDTHAYELFSAYCSLVYVTPILGGFLADKVLGNRMAVMLGALLMAIGHVVLGASEIHPSFLYLSLAIIVCGYGLFKSNVSCLLGE